MKRGRVCGLFSFVTSEKGWDGMDRVLVLVGLQFGCTERDKTNAQDSSPSYSAVSNVDAADTGRNGRWEKKYGEGRVKSETKVLLTLGRLGTS